MPIESRPAVLWGVVAISILVATISFAARRQAPSATTGRTEVVLLGTGAPPADPDRSGPATAVVVNDTPYLVELATKARPRLLVLYHASLSLRPAVDSERSTPAALLREMSQYAGQVVVAVISTSLEE